ncbi:hypothetical protein ID866_8863 [Astraeus odoratus]|nr:hypothetical protein ID866_8863 [Astraeus odoratus]
MSDYIWLGIPLALATVYVAKRFIYSPPPAPLPPGPTPLPFFGNMLDVPSIRPWLTFSEWANKFGDIMHVGVPGKHIIVLNNPKLAVEMLEKKSSKYSDRPPVPMTGELVGGSNLSVLLPYGDRFRESRRLFQRTMGTRAAVGSYYTIEEAETHKFLQRICSSPDRLTAHIRTTAGAILLRISYGYEVKDEQDPLVDLAERGAYIISAGAAPAFLVNVIPILKYVPAWFPGGGFKAKAREWKAVLQEMADRPFQTVKEQLASGVAPKSFTSDLLDGRTLSQEYETVAKWVAASIYAGGADTIFSSTYAFFLAMTLFPEAQKKAHAEIDAVIGPDRLPRFSDRSSLPYVEALVKEVHRWHVVVPMGFVHRTTDDDIHNGYYIPKGSWVFPNTWFMLRDPRSYPNPSVFNPDRFLAREGHEPEPDPRTICFGFGRRFAYLPVGLHLADASVWLTAVMTLAVFDIGKIVENGVEVTPEVDPTPEMLRCTIKPRSAKALELIQQDVQY